MQLLLRPSLQNPLLPTTGMLSTPRNAVLRESPDVLNEPKLNGMRLGNPLPTAPTVSMNFLGAPKLILLTVLSMLPWTTNVLAGGTALLLQLRDAPEHEGQLQAPLLPSPH